MQLSPNILKIGVCISFVLCGGLWGWAHGWRRIKNRITAYALFIIQAQCWAWTEGCFINYLKKSTSAISSFITWQNMEGEVYLVLPPFLCAFLNTLGDAIGWEHSQFSPLGLSAMNDCGIIRIQACDLWIIGWPLYHLQHLMGAPKHCSELC